MKNGNQILTIPVSSIIDPDTFEEMRLDVYRNGNGDRSDLLTSLGEATDFDVSKPYPVSNIGKTGLAGVVYDVVTDDEARIVDIFKREILEEDTELTDARRRMQRRLPSGPGQNGIHVRAAFRPRRPHSPRTAKKPAKRASA